MAGISVKGRFRWQDIRASSGSEPGVANTPGSDYLSPRPWSKMTQGLACCDVGIEGKCDSGQHSPTLSLDSKNKNIHGNENFADMLSSSNHTDHVNTLSQRSCGCNANKRRSHNRMKNRMPGKSVLSLQVTCPDRTRRPCVPISTHPSASARPSQFCSGHLSENLAQFVQTWWL